MSPIDINRALIVLAREVILMCILKTWWGQQYRVAIICFPLVEIGLRWMPKLGRVQTPCPQTRLLQ